MQSPDIQYAASLLEAAPLARLGIAGGGQLARMMTMKAKKLGCHVIVLDPQPQSPAGLVATREITGGFVEPEALRELAAASDVITYDLENVDTGVLRELEAGGAAIYPRPALLETVQDKLRQKETFARHGLATAPFEAIDAPSRDAFAAFGYPLVQKARRGGYDGKGVAVLAQPADFANALPVPSIVERKAAIRKELAVIVARGRDGAIAVYPAAEMVFDPRGNLLDMLLAPAQVPVEVAEGARKLAAETVVAFEGVGIFGVEMFWLEDGGLWLNEIAPRPHNSGHYTIEACLTCQFEQHVRAVLGLPLGSPRQVIPCAMVNLLGEPGSCGKPQVRGLPQALALPGVSVHLYGKTESRPLRKMGHVTVVDDSLESARQKALYVREHIQITGEEPA